MLNRWILWINKRNNTYIKEFNPTKWIRLANNKNQTKRFLTQRGIPVPQTLAHLKTRQDWLSFDFWKIATPTFVIKPNKGSKGSGIFVIQDVRKAEIPKKDNDDSNKKFKNFFSLLRQSDQYYITDHWYEFLIGKKWISESELKLQSVGIYDGSFSSSNKTDTILIEDRLIPGTWFTEFCKYGLADMRVIMFNLVPIIAMLRMPTQESGGKANLAQWGIGLGLDIVSGKITSLYRKWQSYTSDFPSEWKHFKNKKIPYRQEIIQYSANAQYFVNIWYLGMDWVITNKWPKLLEINARSWLEIQNITGKPLLSIMRKIEDLDITTPSKGIEISKSLFSDERINELKDQHIVYLSQTGKLLYQREGKKRGLPVTITVWIDKVKNYTSEKVLKRLMWATDVMIDLGHHDTIFKNLTFSTSKDIQWNKIILWQQSLANYYIKPIHKSKVSTRSINPDCIIEDELVSLKLLDERISAINKQLNLAQILQPTNYLDEFDKFVSLHGEYNPQFTYNFPTYKELHQLTDQIKELDVKYRQKEYFDSTFANLFFEKLDEMQTKVNLIKAYKKQDFWLIDRYNRVLFGEIDDKIITEAENILKTNKLDVNLLWWFVDALKAKSMCEQYMWTIWWKYKVVITSNQSRMSIWFWSSIRIKIASQAKFREIELLWVLAHEIDTHIKRFINWSKTWWNILQNWTAYYLTTEEWLAVYNATKKIQEYVPDFQNTNIYGKYLLVNKARISSFQECYTYLINLEWYYKQSRSYQWLFNKVLKQKKWIKDTSKWWAYMKDAVYALWYHNIRNLSNENIKKLYKWKIKLEDLEYFNN